MCNAEDFYKIMRKIIMKNIARVKEDDFFQRGDAYMRGVKEGLTIVLDELDRLEEIVSRKEPVR